MSRSALLKSRSSRRLAALASAFVLAVGGALTLVGTASASGAAPADPACSDATLHGTYSYGYEGWSVSKGAKTPSSTAGFDHFNGAGTSTGVTTFVSNGAVIDNNTADTSTYTLQADCAGKIVFNVAGSLAHFNIYVNPSGQSFTIIQTDHGSVEAGTETRVS
jgi:hypothetical protein